MKKMYGKIIKNYSKKKGWIIMLKERGSYWAKWAWRRRKVDALKEMNRVLRRHNKMVGSKR